MWLGVAVALTPPVDWDLAQATGVAGQRKRNPCGEESGWLLASNVVLDPTVLKRAAVFLEVEGDLGGGAASSCPHVLPLASRPDPSGHAGVPCGGDAGWPCVELGSYLSMSVGSEAVRCVPFRNPCLFGRTAVMLPKREPQSECRRGPSQPRRAGTRLQGF